MADVAPVNTSSLDVLLEHLELDQTEAGFRGPVPQFGWRRIFGGLVVAQALRAAINTVEADRPVHSLHAYFMRPGDPTLSIDYAVNKLRDGRSFSTRHVTALQNDRPILILSASFQVGEDGFEHQMAAIDVPDPDALPSEADLLSSYREKLPLAVRTFFERPRPIEIRPTDFSHYFSSDAVPPRQAMWLRARSRLLDDAVIHQTVLAYASDMTILDAALIPHGKSVFSPDLQVASLDHAVWFHKSTRFDDWHLYVQDSPRSSGARGMTRGLIYDRSGVLVASVAQEGLIRQR
ncbi:MAG: acyl-CoA thioesterase II [Pseudomonadota bacterium]